MYLVGIVWCIVMMTSAFILLDPVFVASQSFDLSNPMLVTAATMGLAVLLATVVAVGLWVLLKRTVAGRIEVTDRV
jgi:hypothetical protein